ncbi:hypothetical protein F5883DRAFT_671071 [Diaporthe sp. PMI_573]|nr:hypothetical protein F5883DRAFT_671071 [Diaporthaceae sp. PMI_573]
MDVFKDTNAAPYSPCKVPFKSTTIRIPKNDELLARQPRSNLLCTVCPQPGNLICSGCHSMRYCSEACQREDRSTHKFFCRSFDQFSTDKRPSPQHIRAILFPENKKKPEWAWVLRNDDRTAVSLSHMYEGLPTDGLTDMTPIMYMSCTTKRVSQQWLFSLCLDQSSRGEHTSSINRSVLNLGPPGHLQTYWGPILVVAGLPELAPLPRYPDHPMRARLEDVSMNDTWFVIEAVLYGDHDSPCVVNVPRYPYPSLPALKINCVGDRARFHPDKDRRSDAATYESVTVPNKEAISIMRQYPCIAPFLLGLPWLCRLVPNCFDLYHGEDHDSFFLPSPLANPELGCIHACLRQHGSQLIGAPGPQVRPTQACNIEETQPPGTVILVHVFGEPIRLEHVKVFNLFYDHAQPDNWYVPGTGYKTFNRDAFRKFWDNKKAENNIPGVDLSDVPSPYAWVDKPRQEDKYVEGFAEWERFLRDTVIDVFFDNVFRGGRPSPLAGRTAAWAQEMFDPLN